MIKVIKLDHVQICIPVGAEDRARAFYTDILGFKEIPKPQSLLPNGGLWYKVGDIELHIGVEPFQKEHSKRHPAFEVANLAEVRRYFEKQGVKTRDETPIPNVERFSCFDPFGNRIEFLERKPGRVEEGKRDVQNQFGRSAEAYVTSDIHAKGRDLAKLVEIAAVTPQDVVLDVGTGGGHVANALAPLAAKVIAMDLTPEMLEAAQRFISANGYQNVDYVQGDAEQMPFGPETFDVVACRIAAHHFPNVQKFINEVFRVLRPSGRFLLVDNVAAEDDEIDQFYNEIEKLRDYSHVRAWKKSEWVRMLEENGLVIEECYRFAKTFAFEEWCSRMNLPEEDKRELAAFIVRAPAPVRQKLKVTAEGDRVTSFEGEAVLIKAVKLS
ncbi:ubiquinone/menaquinone biosynthesis C-methylase UbiE/catechol 2,3-dioxygenase-like lactoylglutathione lyase family enzyme [Caldalkalibacillus uzonensis]|uniref:Ubiquinone/menaquinone biosynthesis C-methylase UbiE/catechol 2,3-dioxygenase-like lactoylglutathione lyase family enzyme n=1 Tax=Caldalkalibacillus uzonensis TaxID=353224 RepID=A0ABU0CNK6_9BACI|nr:methyltransferase domain-containing protein [Caldalkalibacillus uzonensis]MDQ0337471.1 ubiquinone/menaquinone biosynthesis C-methylase UbiE/catechol 2,3-dioxygenase-like lactoylglutathione lyase family enzyme [Caldalkalibacillus uzonensis]